MSILSVYAKLELSNLLDVPWEQLSPGCAAHSECAYWREVTNQRGEELSAGHAV
jgi:hypothetical protein